MFYPAWQFGGILVPLMPRRLWFQSQEGFRLMNEGLKGGLEHRENKSLLSLIGAQKASKSD